MLYQESHPSDQELVMAADGELSGRRESAVREHLACCWSCRTRMNEIEAAIRKTGCDPLRMASGAGHDAMILAEKVPAAMIFLRSPGGVSHGPAESIEVDDVAKALECGLYLLDQLAVSAEFLKRTYRA